MSFVRERYSRSAVETAAQKRWVADFAAHAIVNGWIGGTPGGPGHNGGAGRHAADDG